MRAADLDLTPVVLRVDHVTKEFGALRALLRTSDGLVRAVDDVSFEISRGESFGLVGESGSGKTTIGRVILRFVDPTSGTITFGGRNVRQLRGRELLEYRRQVQMIYQNPFLSLNPRRSIRDTLAASYEIHGLASGAEREPLMRELLSRVGLAPGFLEHYPHQLSGGQRQRIVIARALSVGPSFVVADEPVSALDVSIQAQVLNLLKGLQREFGLTFLLIAHDLRVVNFFCDRIGVLYLGTLVELGPRKNLVKQPLHPYTVALLASAPSLEFGATQRRAPIRGEISDEPRPLEGCVFAPRCPLRKRLGSPALCVTQRPALRPIEPGRASACHFAEELQSDRLDQDRKVSARRSGEARP